MRTERSNPENSLYQMMMDCEKSISDELGPCVAEFGVPAKKFYINTTFRGRYPVGTAAVVRASSVDSAAEILNEKLKSIGLPGDVEAWQMTCISDTKEDGAIILCDGDY